MTKKRFADTLIEMSKDDINFEQQNINFFIKFAEYIMENYESAEKFITINEHDKALKQLAEEYYNFNEEKFLNLMREEQSRTQYGSTSFGSGSLRLQMPLHLAQRVWNLHPEGGFAGDGMLP